MQTLQTTQVTVNGIGPTTTPVSKPRIRIMTLP